MIRDFEPRIYQQTILSTATEKNTLVVLPTGLGKTYIFLMLSAYRLKKYPDSKILFLGPTRPLISQYYELFLKHLKISPEDMAIFTGNVTPEKREKLWKASKIVFSTPQGMENDIISNRIDLSDVCLLGFDEAHRAVGDYSYVWVAQQYIKKAKNQRIIGLTASPGSDLEKISEVCKNLNIEGVEIRDDNDPDVKPYIKEVSVKWVYVELPDYFKRVQKYLKDCFNSKVSQLKQYNGNIINTENKRDLLALQSQILSEISRGNSSIESMKSLSLLAEAIKVQHALELLESQGITPLLEFMENLIAKATTSKTKAVKNLVSDLNFKSALVLARNLKESKIEHPKYAEVKKLLSDYVKNKDIKIILFCQYRDSISSLTAEISKIDGVNAKIFVGQAKKKGTGLTQKEQVAILNEFRENKFNVLVMSSVGEEGLDIPAVDVVLFYEPVPSAIRTIQRRGRTGRQTKGEVIILVTKGTRDEAYRWTSHYKERQMNVILKELKKKFFRKKTEEKNISEFLLPENGLTVYADHREKASGVIKKLVDLGILVKLDNLTIGDYLVSSDLCIEHKTVSDFIDSILDRRLFTQLRDMKKYAKQLLLLEGEEDLYAQRKLHPNAVRGMLSVICIDYGVPIIYTKDPNETALMIGMIAKRAQASEKKEFTLHSAKPLTLKQQQEYLISSLPGVGPVLSKPLLEKFGSVKSIMNASENDLKEVEQIGDKKASKIKEIIDSEYKKNE